MGLAWLGELAKGVLNTLQHQVVAVLLFFTIWTPLFTYSSDLAVHVALCTLGIFPFIVEGLAVLGYDLIYAIELEEKTRGIIHGVMMGMGTLFIAIGAIWEMSRERLTSHFSSAHGVLGLLCLLLVLIAFVLGFFARFAKALKGYAKPVYFQFAHNLLGILAFVFGVSCVCTGYYLNEFALISRDVSRDTATAMACLMIPWSLSTACYKLYKQAKAMFL